MITRNPNVSSVPSFLFPCLIRPYRSLRTLHGKATAAHIPPPTPFVPDAKTFLTLIGRGLSQHTSKIPNWDGLFSLSSSQLRELGLEPARDRRYLLWWRDKFRKGEYGIGGDLQYVQDGVAEVRVVEVPKSTGKRPATVTTSPGMKKVIVNLPPEQDSTGLLAEEVKRIAGMKIQGAQTIVGSYLEPLKGANGSVARIKVQEGMWEERRGHKVDGGERRKANVRSKRAAAERAKNR